MIEKNNTNKKDNTSFNQEIIPLNSKLYSDFSLDELEERLEMAEASPWICIGVNCDTENM